MADLGPFTLLDAAATTDAAGPRVALTVVNRDRERPHEAWIDLGHAGVEGEVLVSEVNGPDVGAVNSFASPRSVDVVERTAKVGGGKFEYSFPAHSVSVLRFGVRPRE